MTDYHIGDIGKDNGLPVSPLYERTAEFLQIGRPGHAPQSVFIVIVSDHSAHGIVAECFPNLFQFGKRNTVSIHFLWIGENLVLFQFSSDIRHLRHSARGEYGGLDYPIGKCAKFHHRGRVSLQSDQQDFAHDAGLRREYGSDSRRKGISESDHLFRNNLPRLKNIHTPVELRPDERETLHGSRTHPTYIRRSIYRGLDRKSNQTFHLFSCHAVRVGHDNDRRSCQVGEHIYIHLL